MVLSCDFPLPPRFDAFISRKPACDPVTVVVLTKPTIEPPGVRVSREQALSYWRKGTVESISLENGEGEFLGCLTCEPAWKTAILRIQKNADKGAVLKILTELFFRSVLSRQGRGLVLHAAALSHSGKGVAFVGRSGMGKSTQAHLWERLRGALVLNDDRPAVTLERGTPLIHGTPWSGTSDKRVARSVPLQALVFLDQAPSNTVRRLPLSEAVSRLLPRVFLPYWSECGLSTALSTAGHLLRQVRSLHLSCLPDEGAVACLEKELQAL